MATNSFLDSNKKTKYGQHDVQFWIGTVVAYAAQQKQIEEGFGWMYKVRIDGDHSVGADQIKDEELSYAYCLLPTTAGSGAAFKLRSVRISQGDTVFGLRGGGVGSPRFIIGVFPRTRETKFKSSGNFAALSGFFGALKKNKTLSGEFNDQVGPATPGVTAVGPDKWNKAIAKEPSKQIKQLGYDPNQSGEIVNVEEKLKPKVTDPNKVYTGGEKEPITKGQLEQILSTESDEEKNQILSKTIPEVGEKIILEDGTEGVVKDVRLIGEQSAISGTSLGPSASEIIPYTPLASREKVSVVNGVEVTTTEITLDPNGEKFGGEFSSRSDTKTNTAHKKPGGVEAYWANLEKERELTEKEQRWRRNGWDQFGASKKSYTKTFGLIGGGPVLEIGGVASWEENARDKWKSYTVKSILKAQTQGLVEDNVAVEATSLVEQGRFTDALNLVFPSGYNPTLEI